jgi:hypothetical protein
VAAALVAVISLGGQARLNSNGPLRQSAWSRHAKVVAHPLWRRCEPLRWQNSRCTWSEKALGPEERLRRCGSYW